MAKRSNDQPVATTNVEAVAGFWHSGKYYQRGDVLPVPAAEAEDLEAMRFAMRTEKPTTVEAPPANPRGFYNRRDMRAKP